MSAYRVGIIGCGSRSADHAAGWAAIEAVQVAAVADPVKDRRERLAAQFGAEQAFDDFRPLLSQAKPDFVSVVLQPALREAVIDAAVDAGVKGILCEKPIALTTPEAQRMVATCRDARVPLVINFQKRHLPEWQRLAELCRQGRLGPLRYINASSRGNLLGQGSHVMDMVLCMVGDVPPRAVIGQAIGWNDTYHHPAPYMALGQIDFDESLVAYVTFGDLAPVVPGNDEFWFNIQMTIVATDGVGQVTLTKGGRAWLRGQNDWESWSEGWLSPGNLAVAQKALSESVIQAAQDPHYEPPASGRHALLGQQILEAICASALQCECITWPPPDWDEETAPLAVMARQQEASG